ncbi:uncharacterized protein LOC112451797, partial [Temnothorax curvispinosus]|uniref:Uncharacterized protein LOC112451797 n=1 Tax=Temnothorax curvispinosus TaxID=300111 RepID=A0A6J1PD51_9HYME
LILSSRSFARSLARRSCTRGAPLLHLHGNRKLNARRRVTTGGARGGRASKVSKRAKPLDPDEDDYYYDDPVDERNNPTNEAPAVPPGFLSPSVREYLDLGKSIP